MANRTVSDAVTIHGSNPQYLIEKILRTKIYNSTFWKEQCFGLSAEGIVDRAMELTSYGGMFGGTRKPTHFMCLVLKLLQIQPAKDVVVEFIKNEEYRYVRILGAFYLRLVGKSKEIFQYLEPLLNDYRKIRKQTDEGYMITHVDETIDELLHEGFVCDVQLPHLQERRVLEDAGDMPMRRSALEDDFEGDLDAEVEAAVDPQAAALDLLASTSEDGEGKGKPSDEEAPEPEPERDERRRRPRSRSRSRSRSPDHRRRDRRDRDRDRDRDRRYRSRDDGRRHSRSRSPSRSRRYRERGRRERSANRSRSRSRSRDRGRHGDYRRRRRERSRSYSRERDRRRADRRDESGASPKRKVSKKEKKDTAPAAAKADTGAPPAKPSKYSAQDPEIIEANKLRAKLGLKPLAV